MINVASSRGLLFSILICIFSFGVMSQGQTPGSTNAAPSEQDPLLRPRPDKNVDKKKVEKAFGRWLDEVSLIILPEERDAFRKLRTDAERQSFIELFWQHRDPTPETEENEYKEEYYRRKAYANERYSAGVPGWKTDRGRMYILHGPPESIDSHPAGGPYQVPRRKAAARPLPIPLRSGAIAISTASARKLRSSLSIRAAAANTT